MWTGPQETVPMETKSQGMTWHICQFSPVDGICDVDPNCGRKSPLWNDEDHHP